MPVLQLLQINSTGALVKAWQYFLIGKELYAGKADGRFGPATRAATIRFQQGQGLSPDGIVGNKTWGAALLQGLDLVQDRRSNQAGAAWPPKPRFLPLVSNADRAKRFGSFRHVADPRPGEPERIRVTDQWVKENIVSVSIPQLKAIAGMDKVYFHRKAADQLAGLWEAWEAAGLLHLVLTFDGSYAPRFVRGSRTVLSNHAFGSAFDINAAWNGLGQLPALVGQKGSVRELVPIAQEYGFYWGGHFSRRDGMHFEVARILK